MKLIKGDVGSPSSLTPTPPCAPRPKSGPYVPPRLERAIAARWKVWVPWVRMQLLRARRSDPIDSAVDRGDSTRLRQRHSEHILDLLCDGISMRTIRRHLLYDPRITDEDRVLLLQATKRRPQAPTESISIVSQHDS